MHDSRRHVNGDKSAGEIKTANVDQRRSNMLYKSDEGQPIGVAASPSDNVSSVSAHSHLLSSGVRMCEKIFFSF